MQLRSHKLYLMLLVFFAMTGTGHAYTPITWVDGNPNNLFAPLCLKHMHSEKKMHSSWQGYVRTNLFAATQSDYWATTTFGGIAIQGHLYLDKVLHGLYGQIYVPTVLAARKEKLQIFSSDLQNTKEKSRYSSSATIADIPFLLGWSAFKKKRFQLDSYVFGILPTAKHSLFRHGRTVPYSGFDNHFSCGVGGKCFVRLCGNPQHHLDWISEVDVTFCITHKENWIFYTTDDEWKNTKETPILIKTHAHQLYKIQSGLTYRFKHFISDLGIQRFFLSSINYSLVDTTLTNIPPLPTPEMNSSELFCDIGFCMKLGQLPSYITLGANWRLQGLNCSRMWGINLKFGLDF